MSAYCVKDVKKDSKEFFHLYLDALYEELAELQTYISTSKPLSAPSVEKHEGEEGQTEEKMKDDTVS